MKIIDSILLTLRKFIARFYNNHSNQWGQFSATPKVEFLPEGRQVRLLEDFIFTDREGKEWRAEKDHVVDGASIPRIFWAATEGPLDGKFRNASIVHDVACDEKKKPWQAVHLCFYEACRCGGVPEHKAKLLYMAVYLFGPRWEIVTQRLMTGIEPISIKKVIQLSAPIPPVGIKEKLEQLIKDHNPSIEELKTINLQGVMLYEE